MWFKAAAGLLLLGNHLLISSTRTIRGWLVRQLGEPGYLIIYSLVALATLSIMVELYTELPRFDYFWLPSPELYLAAKVLMAPALLFSVGGLMIRNPGAAGMAGTLANGPPAQLARGLARITRHPFQWGVVMWAAAHIMANGDPVSVVFFGTFLLTSLAGTVLIDRRKAATLGAPWRDYVAATSNLPFLAIVQGRNRLAIGELWVPGLTALAAYGLLGWGHTWVSGARIF
jgi:uncharacterized membrane protein